MTVSANATIICKVPTDGYRVVDIQTQNLQNENLIDDTTVSLIKNSKNEFDKVDVLVTDDYFSIDSLIHQQDLIENLEKVYGGEYTTIDVDYYSKNKNQKYDCLDDCFLYDARNTVFIKKSRTDSHVKLVIDKKIKEIKCVYDYPLIKPTDSLLRKVTIIKNVKTTPHSTLELTSSKECDDYKRSYSGIGECIIKTRSFLVFKRTQYLLVYFNTEPKFQKEFIIQINKKDNSFKVIQN